MNSLVILKKQNLEEVPFTTSKVIAEQTKTQHHTVTKLIQNHQDRLEKFGRLRFEIDTLLTKGGNQETKFYYLNEQQSTLLVTFMKNTDVVADFKVELVCQFYAMKQILLQKQSSEWKGSRKNGQLQNAFMTEAIDAFTKYAQSQGSTNFKRYFNSIPSLVNKTVGIDDGKRDYSEANVLMAQSLFMNVVTQTLYDEMTKGTHYKQVYKVLLSKSEEFMQYFQPQKLRLINSSS